MLHSSLPVYTPMARSHGCDISSKSNRARWEANGVGDRYPPGLLEGERPLHGATDQLPRKVVSSWAKQRPQVKWADPRRQWARARIVRWITHNLKEPYVFPAPGALERRG
jgi:hypothetical protein